MCTWHYSRHQGHIMNKNRQILILMQYAFSWKGRQTKTELIISRGISALKRTETGQGLWSDHWTET